MQTEIATFKISSIFISYPPAYSNNPERCYITITDHADSLQNKTNVVLCGISRLVILIVNLLVLNFQLFSTTRALEEVEYSVSEQYIDVSFVIIRRKFNRN